mmetsp:Transcript_2086/g.2982  ORF Transcript_2086/g.2982 Transcript_2086/m.2982 type:complete len:84 (+) Transcript_2086:548-799(+)
MLTISAMHTEPAVYVSHVPPIPRILSIKRLQKTKTLIRIDKKRLLVTSAHACGAVFVVVVVEEYLDGGCNVVECVQLDKRTGN